MVRKKRDESSEELVRYFRTLAQVEEKNTFMVFGRFSSKKKLANGYTVKVSISEPRKKVTRV